MTRLERLADNYRELKAGLEEEVVEHDDLIEQLLVTLLSRGHCLIEGPPGSARALTAARVAAVLGLQFGRIRANRELTPEELLQPLSTADSPLLAGIVLVDDLPRLPPRALSLVDQLVQERSLVFEGQRYELPAPQMVVATSYSADEALEHPWEPRDDRFMLKIKVKHPEYATEYRIAETAAGRESRAAAAILGPEDLLELQQEVRQISVPPPVLHYAMRLVRSTRLHDGETSDFVYEWVSAGAGPRAAHHLTLAAKVRAALHGREQAIEKDVQEMVFPVLRHRIQTNQNARSNGITVDRVIGRLLYETPARVPGDDVPFDQPPE